MNRPFRQFKLGAIGAGLVFSLTIFTPAMTLAAPATPKESPFCTNLPNTISKVSTDISNLKSKMTAERSKLDQQIAAGRAKWDQEIKNSRAKWDQERQGYFLKLEAKATTDAQKSAVKTYEAAITAAVNIRRTANDAARTTYYAGVDSAISNQRATVDGQVATFTGSVNSAESTAQSSCAATPSSGPDIRTTFQAAMKSARESYTAARKSDGNIKDQVKQLAQTRDASFKSNDATFDASSKAARDALKAAFKSTNI
ncbi:hypothetical protein BVY00_01580 [bacterium G20]|nr:hypothetical protein BVY00_01580 [bacterium G20]